jgi:hypothetical protein
MVHVVSCDDIYHGFFWGNVYTTVVLKFRFDIYDFIIILMESNFFCVNIQSTAGW